MADDKPHDALPVGHPAVHQGHYCQCGRDVRDPIHRGVIRWDKYPSRPEGEALAADNAPDRAASGHKEVTMKATLYTWEGSPETGRKRAIGEVRMDPDSPAAVWDASLDAYFDPMPNDTRTNPRKPLDPARGEDFIQALPYVFKAAPYCWAEVSGVTTAKDVHAAIIGASTKAEARVAMDVAERWLEEHPDDVSVAEELDSLMLILSAPDSATEGVGMTKAKEDYNPGDVIAVRGETQLILDDPVAGTGHMHTPSTGYDSPVGLIDGFLKFGYWEEPEGG